MKHKAKIVKTVDGWYIATLPEFGLVIQERTLQKVRESLKSAYEEQQVFRRLIEQSNKVKEEFELYLESFGVQNVPEHSEEVLLYPLEVAVHG